MRHEESPSPRSVAHGRCGSCLSCPVGARLHHRVLPHGLVRSRARVPALYPVSRAHLVRAHPRGRPLRPPMRHARVVRRGSTLHSLRVGGAPVAVGVLQPIKLHRKGRGHTLLQERAPLTLVAFSPPGASWRSLSRRRACASGKRRYSGPGGCAPWRPVLRAFVSQDATLPFSGVCGAQLHVSR